jgi:hypothetical protein
MKTNGKEHSQGKKKMVTLLRKRLRRKEEEGTGHEAKRPAEPDRDRILLLVPVEGGFSFQLFAFPTVESVAAYVHHHFPQRAEHLVVFRAAHEQPFYLSGAQAVETVVLVRDVDRPGIVNLYSFVDMETANAFIRSEAMRGLPLHYVLLFWAEPVSLDATGHTETPVDKPTPQEQPAPYYLQTIPPVELPMQPSISPEPDSAPDMPAKEVLRGEPNPFLTAGRTDFASDGGVNGDFAPDMAQAAPAEVAPAAASPFAAPIPPMAFAAPAAPVSVSSAPAQPYDPSVKKARRGYVAGIGAAPPAAEAQAPKQAVKQQEKLEGLIQRVLVWDGWDGLGPHMASAMRLRWQTYEEVRKDEYATGRAWLLAGAGVAAAALAAAMQGPIAFFAHGLLAAIGAAVFTGLIYAIGTVVFGGKLNDQDFTLFLQRLGLAAAPGFLLVLGALPIYGPLFLLGALLWIMLTSIKATELSLELDRQSAAYTVIFAWLALFAIAAVMPTIVV